MNKHGIRAEKCKSLISFFKCYFKSVNALNRKLYSHLITEEMQNLIASKKDAVNEEIFSNNKRNEHLSFPSNTTIQ